MYFTAMKIDITKTTANILYPHNCIVVSATPAPYKEYAILSCSKVMNFCVPIFCVHIIIDIPRSTASTLKLTKACFIKGLFLNVSLFTPSK